MKKIEAMSWAFFGAAALYLLHHLILHLFVTHGWEGMNPSDWASWVQAFGSVAAIAAGFAAARYQLNQARAFETSRELAETTRRTKALKWVLAQAKDEADTLGAWARGGNSLGLSRYPTQIISRFSELLKSVPLLDFPDDTSSFEVNHIIGKLDKVADSIHRGQLSSTLDHEQLGYMVSIRLEDSIQALIQHLENCIGTLERAISVCESEERNHAWAA